MPRKNGLPPLVFISPAAPTDSDEQMARNLGHGGIVRIKPDQEGEIVAALSMEAKRAAVGTFEGNLETAARFVNAGFRVFAFRHSGGGCGGAACLFMKCPSLRRLGLSVIPNRPREER